jgi:ribokinase
VADTSRPHPIVCFGGLWHAVTMRVDAVPAEGETVLGFEYDEPYDGGKAADYAVAAVRLGAPVAMVTVVGSDERGARWRERLAEEGIDTSAFQTLEGPTDIGFAFLPDSRVPAMISICDLTWKMTPEVVRRARATLASAAFVVASLECRPEAVQEAFAIAKENGAQTILNSAPAAPLSDELVALTDVLVVNEHEAAVITGESGDIPSLAGALRRRYPELHVIVTAGEQGAYLAAPTSQLLHVPALRVPEVVDTSGAGDAFVGGLAARLWHGDDLPAAVAYGARVASVSVMGMSTMSSYPTEDELAAALARIEGAAAPSA